MALSWAARLAAPSTSTDSIPEQQLEKAEPCWRYPTAITFVTTRAGPGRKQLELLQSFNQLTLSYCISH
jgi:hypothetical protein